VTCAYAAEPALAEGPAVARQGAQQWNVSKRVEERPGDAIAEAGYQTTLKHATAPTRDTLNYVHRT
jgi:hypothetical protein